MHYTIKKGSYVTGDAQVIGETLEAIRQSNGGVLEPQAVVDESRPEEAPLHPHFEWDDNVAAEEYRKNQARHLIRSVRVVKSEQVPHGIPAYLNLTEGMVSRPGYYRTGEVMQSKSLREQVLQRAWNEALNWKRRYSELAELELLEPVFSAIDNITPIITDQLLEA